MTQLGFHLIFWKWYLGGLARPEKLPSKDEFKTLLEQESARVCHWFPYVGSFSLHDSISLSEVSLWKKTGYSYDLHRVLMPFPRHLRFFTKFGDDFKGRFSPVEPTFVKARPINSGNPNWVLLPMDTHRHFQFPQDQVPWEQKKNMAVWRGAAYREKRKRFILGSAGVANADIGTVVETEGMRPFIKPRMSVAQQHQFKFIISLEGNDVATGLKWIMVSNSLCLMPKPNYETWFLEGTLRPGVHYVEIAADGADLEEKIAYYLDRPQEAQEIVRNAQRYVKPFKDPTWNLQLARAVAYRYFQVSGQLA